MSKFEREQSIKDTEELLLISRGQHFRGLTAGFVDLWLGIETVEANASIGYLIAATVASCSGFGAALFIPVIATAVTYQTWRKEEGVKELLKIYKTEKAELKMQKN